MVGVKFVECWTGESGAPASESILVFHSKQEADEALAQVREILSGDPGMQGSRLPKLGQDYAVDPSTAKVAGVAVIARGQLARSLRERTEALGPRS
jgi:hypothetical protein